MSRLVCLFVFLLLLVPFGARAFPPSVGLGAITPGESHAAITKTGVRVLYGELGLTRRSKSMDSALDTLIDANAAIDKDYEKVTAFHCDAENINACSTLVVEALDYTVNALRANQLDEARKQFGGGLHTLQDFYAHTNWIELGNTGLHPGLGHPGIIPSISPAIRNGASEDAPACVETPAGQACMTDNLVTNLLTSGYYSGQDRTRPLGKCRHGGFFDKSPGIGGINKDMSVCTGTVSSGLFDSPHGHLHTAAADLAARATADLLRQLQGKVTPQQFRAFLGVGAPFAFAIDTTGSMGSVIDGVKTQVNAIIDARLGTLEEPAQYVLAPFNDPDVPAAIITGDQLQFKRALAGLAASGGGDCPELSMTGTYNAIAAADSGSQVYTFTDASAKDAARYGSVRDLAAQKHAKLFFPLFGQCSPYDPVYFALARNTGGQVFILNPSEAAQVARLTDMFSRGDTVDIMTVAGTLTPATQTYTFPVDSHITRLQLSVSRTAAGTVTLTRPDGVVVTGTSPGVTNVPLSNAVAYAIATPQTGQWSVAVSGIDTFSILVNGASDLAFSQFGFVEEGGRPGHGGAYPITGSPAPGARVFAMAALGAAAATRRYEMRRPDGMVLDRFTLESNDAGDADVQTGPVTIPAGPFQVYAVGDDDRGTRYQRMIGSVVNPQTVAVTAPAAVGLPRGQATTYVFSVRNMGAAQTFNFTGIDDKGFVTAVTPASALIPAGGAALVSVALAPPGAAAIGTLDTLTFSAASTLDVDARNYAVLSSQVIGTTLFGDVNRDGRIDCDDLGLVKASMGARSGTAAFNAVVDLDNSGLIDARDLATIARLIPAGTNCK